MQWLISQMWILLAVAGVLGLILGLALRGLMGGNKLRRATVERDVARTELGQARAEIDALYASQRKMKEEGFGQAAPQNTQESEALRADLSASGLRITELETALQSARDDLEAEQAKQTEASNSSDALQTAGAAIAGAVVGAAIDDDNDKVRELEERNTWLEERVQALETDIETLGAKPVAEPVIEETQPSVSTGTTKLEWQNSYLRQRVEALENQVHITPILAVDNEANPVDVPEPESEVVAVEENPHQDEEMARLRWRNRYLEGRLAYYEEGANEEEVTVSELAQADPEDVVADADEPVATEAEEDAASEADTVEPVSEPEVTEPESETEVAEPEAPEEHPADAVLRSLGGDEPADDAEAAQPEAFSEPKDGGDDLTSIGGIGPRIAEVLNGLGIWTYGQIAAWSPENAAWVEEHLSFKGRVEREQWVAQAKALLEQVSSD